VDPVTTAEQILAVARRELGTVESPPGSNRTKYGRAYGNDGLKWCAVFLWWVFREAGASTLIHPRTAYTPTLAQWFIDRGRFDRNPRVGDLVFFNWKDKVDRIQHVGLVEAVEPGTIVTIEGNTSEANQSDGGRVMRRRRACNSSIAGYGHPAYALSVPPKPPQTSAVREGEMDQQQTDQLRRDIGFARDQILTRLGVANPVSAPTRLTPEQLAGIDPARRVDVGFARDQIMAELASQRALLEIQADLIEAIAEKLGIPLTAPGQP
jgi:hypothetical protein